ncbi:hypothetical protein M5E87_01960 [Flavonifractor plautii]|nr:hypothetical protein M5E87_01960 [Flavonifractor plautii]
MGHAGNRSLRDRLEGYVALWRCLGAHQQAPEQLLQPRRLGYGLRTLAERTPIGRSRNLTLWLSETARPVSAPAASTRFSASRVEKSRRSPASSVRPLTGGVVFWAICVAAKVI